MSQIDIKYVPIKNLKPAAYNPRQMTQKQAEDLTNSIRKFGLVDPIIVNNHPERKMIIIGGHMRWKIAKELGFDKVPVVFVHLDEGYEKELNLRLNRNLGEWDYDLLANFEPGLLKDVGWTDEELEGIFDLDTITPTEGEDDVPEVPEVAKSKLGDLFQLGNHRLLCGDATSREDVERLMGGKKIDIVFTDPPYGVSYADKNTFLNKLDKGNRCQKEIISDHLLEQDICKLWKNVFEIIRDNLAEVNSYYVTGPQIQGMMMMMMMMMMQEAGLPYRHVIIWVKNNHVLGRCDYNYKHEPLFFGWTTKHKFYGGGEFKTSVWEVDKPLKNALHPTMKPVRLIENALLNSSEKNQICLDPFGGSGSTLIACEKTNRKCFMMELEPLYIDVIVKRWEDFTGKKIVKV
jgi:DNA modification methylase